MVKLKAEGVEPSAFSTGICSALRGLHGRRRSNVANPSTKALCAFVLCSMSVRATMKKAPLTSRGAFSGLVHTVYGILPSEEIRALVVQTGTAGREQIPSGKQVRESAIRRTTRRITQDTAGGGMRTQARECRYLSEPLLKCAPRTKGKV